MNLRKVLVALLSAMLVLTSVNFVAVGEVFAEEIQTQAVIAAADLYAIYCIWCNDNTYKPLAARTVSMTLKKHADEFGLEHDNHITNSLGKQVNGFWGIEPLISPGIL